MATPRVRKSVPGHKTSEFILSVVTVVCATVLLLFERVSSTEWSTMVGGVTGAYAIARTIVKKA